MSSCAAPHSSARDARWLELGGRFGRVNSLFYDAVRAQVEFMLPTLEAGRTYTARQICGEGFWALIGILEARQAGMCLRDLVNRGDVTLSHVQRKCKYPRVYRRK